MPGDDEDDLIDGSSDQLAPNSKCPLTGQDLLGIENPVKCAK